MKTNKLLKYFFLSSLLCTLSCVPEEEPDRGPASDTNFLELSDFMIETVDGSQRNAQLGRVRQSDPLSLGDSCHQPLENNTRFGDAISYFVLDLMNEQKVQLQGVASVYQLSSNVEDYFPVSLVSHPLCRVTSTTLASTFRSGSGNSVRAIPDQATINLANRFSEDHNRLREGYLDGDPDDTKELEQLWARFAGCLGYSEGLPTADTSSSINAAIRNAPANYRRPAGVNFFEDSRQPPVSRLNIGIFQFTNNFSGNINPCIRQWNNDYTAPGCFLERGTLDEYIFLSGAALQHFNSYCGVHKILQTFSVQVNTSRSSRVHPDNVSGSAIIDPASRCVTPHIHATKAYNHFGPLQNTVNNNLRRFMSCIYPGN